LGSQRLPAAAQSGSIGFRATPAERRGDAWNAPGLYFSVSLARAIGTEQDRSLQMSVDRMQREVVLHRDSLAQVQQRLALVEEQLSLLTGPRVEFRKASEEAAAKLVDRIVATVAQPDYDLDQVRAQQDTLLAMGPPAELVLIRLAEHPATASAYRESVLRIMGASRSRQFTVVLLKNLDNPQGVVRREALIALGRIGDMGARDRVRDLVADRDSLVGAVARQVLKTLDSQGTMELVPSSELRTLEARPGSGAGAVPAAMDSGAAGSTSGAAGSSSGRPEADGGAVPTAPTQAKEPSHGGEAVTAPKAPRTQTVNSVKMTDGVNEPDDFARP